MPRTSGSDGCATSPSTSMTVLSTSIAMLMARLAATNVLPSPGIALVTDDEIAVADRCPPRPCALRMIGRLMTRNSCAIDDCGVIGRDEPLLRETDEIEVDLGAATLRCSGRLRVRRRGRGRGFRGGAHAGLGSRPARHPVAAASVAACARLARPRLRVAAPGRRPWRHPRRPCRGGEPPSGQDGARALQLLESPGRLFDQAHRSTFTPRGHQQGEHQHAGERRDQAGEPAERTGQVAALLAGASPRWGRSDSVPKQRAVGDLAWRARVPWNVGRISLATKLASKPGTQRGEEGERRSASGAWAATAAATRAADRRCGTAPLRCPARPRPSSRPRRARQQVAVGLLLDVVVAVELRELGLDLQAPAAPTPSAAHTGFRTTRAWPTAPRRWPRRPPARHASSGTPDSARWTCAVPGGSRAAGSLALAQLRPAAAPRAPQSRGACRPPPGACRCSCAAFRRALSVCAAIRRSISGSRRLGAPRGPGRRQRRRLAGECAPVRVARLHRGVAARASRWRCRRSAWTSCRKNPGLPVPLCPAMPMYLSLNSLRRFSAVCSVCS